MKKVLLLLCAGLCLIVNETVAQKNVLVPYRKGDKWGYCRLNKSVVIAPKYDDASPFSEYDDEKDRYSSRATAEVIKDGKEIYINTAGKVVEWTGGSDDSGIDMGELMDRPREMKMQEKDGKVGLVSDDEIILEHRFDSIRINSWAEQFAFVKLDGNWGVIATGGENKNKWLVPAQFDAVEDMQPDDLFFKVTKNGKKGVWSNNREVLKPEHTDVSLVGAITHYCAIATFENDGVRLFGLDGKSISQEVFEDIIQRVDKLGAVAKGYDKLLYVRKNGKWGLINNTGKAVTGFRYDDIAPFRWWPFTEVVYKGKKGYIGVNGTEFFDE